MKLSSPWKTPRPVAEVRPWMPPWLTGLPVMQAEALRLPKPMVLEKVSAIQAISLSPVPMSGAGTSSPGPRKPFLASSMANLLVILSSSFSLYSWGSSLTPALAPPKGTSTQAHL